MVLASSSLPTMHFTIPALEAFPTSLSILNLAGLQSHLDKESAERLVYLENQFQSNVPISKILHARSKKGFEDSLIQGFKQAVSYYVESGIIIWRAINNDYDSLLEISNISANAVEKLFFDQANKLNQETFINAVTGLRVLTKVGEWVIQAEKHQSNGTPPVNYLTITVGATFLMWCIVAYLAEDVKNARKENLASISNGIIEFAQKAYDDAIKSSMHEIANEPHHWYWNPSWQEGEVEADLDKHFKKTKKFDSVAELIEDLKK